MFAVLRPDLEVPICNRRGQFETATKCGDHSPERELVRNGDPDALGRRAGLAWGSSRELVQHRFAAMDLFVTRGQLANLFGSKYVDGTSQRAWDVPFFFHAERAKAHPAV
jgi:hypothetical protein